MKRNDRPQVLIDSVTMTYQPNIQRAITGTSADLEALSISTDVLDSGGGAAAAPAANIRSGRGFRTNEMGESVGRGRPQPMPTPEATPTDTAAVGPRGFVVTIKGYTPNKGGDQYVTSTFATQLVSKTLQQQLDAGKRYHIVKADLSSAGQRVRSGVDGAVEPVEVDDMFGDADFGDFQNNGARGAAAWKAGSKGPDEPIPECERLR